MKFKSLIPGNTIYVLSMDPDTHKIINIVGGIVDNINQAKTVLGVRISDPSDKSKMIVLYFRVNPDSEINDSLQEDKEHRVSALFESKTDAISGYIKYCEDKIQHYKDNIKDVEQRFIIS